MVSVGRAWQSTPRLPRDAMMAYDDDLARVHDEGFTQLAVGARAS